MFQENQNPYQPRPQYPETMISNILISVVCVFMIVVAFFILAVLNVQIDTTTGYRDFEQDFGISVPIQTHLLYTQNPHLSSISVQAYNSSNTTWSYLPSSEISYDSSKGLVTVNASAMKPYDTTLKIESNTDYALNPYSTVLTVIAISLIIGSIAMLFGVVARRIRR